MTAISWKSGISGDWSVSTDWNPATIPGSTSQVTIAAASASPYTVTVSLAEAANTLTLNSANASLQVNNTLTMGGALTLTSGTLDLAGVIKGGQLLLNGGSLAPGGGTLDGVKVQGTLQLTQAFGSPLVVEGGLTLTNLVGTGPGLINLTGLGAKLSFAPGVQTLTSAVAGQPTTLSIGSTSGDTVSEQNAVGTITTATLAAPVTTDQTGQYATLTASSQAGDSLVNQGFINAALAGGTFTINGGSFANSGTITANLGDTVTIATTNFSNTGTINVLNTGTLNIGQGGAWTSTGVISETDATVNLLGNVTTAEVKAITSRAGGQIDLAGTLALGGGTLSVGTGTTIGDVLLTGTVANGIIHDAGLGMQFGTSAYPAPTLNGVTYQGSLDLSEPWAHLTVLGAFTVTGTSGTGAGVINLTGNSSNLTLTGSRTLDNATLRIGDASINITNPGTTTAVTFGPHLTIEQGGVAPNVYTSISSSITGSYNATDSLLNQGGIYGSLQNGAFTIQGFGTFTNAGAIGFSNGNNLAIDNIGTITNQNSITLGNGVTATFGGSSAFNNPGVISAGFGDNITITGITLTNAGTMSIGFGSSLGIGSFSAFVNQGTISLATGATLDIGSSLAAWSSTGTITSNDATVELEGIVTQAQIGAITRVGGGVIDIVGTLNDTSAPTTLNVGTGSAFGALELTGTIVGGIIHDAGGGLTYVNGQLSGVVYEGTVDLSEQNAMVEVDNGIGFTGTAGTGAGRVNLTGVGAQLLVSGTTVLDNATIDLGAAPSEYYETGALLGAALSYSTSATLLTLGAHLLVQQVGQSGTIAGPTHVTDMLINRGSINAGLNGGDLVVSGNQFENLGIISVSNGAYLDITASSFTNAGTVSVLTGGTLGVGSGGDWISAGKVIETGATVLLQGDVTLPEITSITRTGGALVIAGRFNNQGSTLSVGTGSALGDFVLAGTIDNGIIHDAGGGFVFHNGTLDSVTYQGVVDLSEAGADLTVLGGLIATDVTGTKPGLINLTGSDSILVLQEPQTLDNATVDIGNAQTDSIEVTTPFFGGSGWTTTLGSKLDIVQTGTSADLAGTSGTTDTLLNDGTIAAGFAHGAFAIAGADFVNAGSILVSNGDTLNMAATVFSNTGTVKVTTGGTLNVGPTLDYLGGGSWTSTGVLNENGGAINLDDPVSLSNLNSITRTGGVITLNSTADLGGGTLDVGAGSVLGALVNNGTIQNGTVHDAGSGLSFVDEAFNNVTDLGTLNMSASDSALTINGSIAFAGLTGTGLATILLTGQNSTMSLVGTEELNNANLSLGGATLGAEQSGLYYENPIPGVLTLGPGLTISHTVSSNGTIGTAQITSSAGYESVASGAVINQGIIDAGLMGGLLEISGTSFTNQGTLETFHGDQEVVQAGSFSNTGFVNVNNAIMTIGALSSEFGSAASGFSNTGTVTVTGGATLNLGPAGAANGFTWTSSGVLSETNGSIFMNGPVTLANLNSITRSGGTVTLAGVGNLGAGTLDLGTGSVLGALVLTGTIENGTIHDAGLGLQPQAGTLIGMGYQGTLDLNAAGAALTVEGSLTLTGLAGTGMASIVMANSGELTFVGAQTLGNAVVQANGGASLESESVTTNGTTSPANLTLASTLSIINSSGNFAIGGGGEFGFGASGVITNLGGITAEAPGGLFTINSGSLINGNLLAVSNHGTLAVDSGVFNNSGVVTVTTGGVVNIGAPGGAAGLIALAPGTPLFAPGAVGFAGLGTAGRWIGGGPVTVSTGGSLNIYDTAALVPVNAIKNSGGYVSEYGLLALGGGTFDVGAGSNVGLFTLIGGEAQGGTIHDAGGGLQFYAAGNSGGTVPAALVNVTVQTQALDQSEAGSSLSFDGTLTVTGLGGTGTGLWDLTGIQATAYAVGTTSLNNVTINIGNPEPAGSTLAAVDPDGEGGAVFTLNSGVTINVVGNNAAIDNAPGPGDMTVNDGKVEVNLPGSMLSLDGGTFLNDGTFTLGSGASVASNTDTTMTNNGLLSMTGGSFDGPLNNASGGTIAGVGTINGPVTGSGTITAEVIGAAKTLLVGAAVGNTLDVGSAAALNIAGVLTGGSVNYLGTVGELLLGVPASATTTPINGFLGFDEIDLLGTAVTALTYAGSAISGVLTVTDASATVAKLEFNGDFTTQSFAKSTDNAGGTLITFVAGHGSGGTQGGGGGGSGIIVSVNAETVAAPAMQFMLPQPVVSGAAGNETLLLPGVGDGVATVTQFGLTNGDVLDLRNAMLGSAWNGDASLIGDFVSTSQSGGNTFVNVAPSGQGAGSTIAVLAGLDTTLAQLTAHHAISYS